MNGELKVIYQNGALLIDGNVNRYSLSGNIKVDFAKPYLMRGEISATRGGSETFKLALNTQRFPYTFEIFPASIAGLRKITLQVFFIKYSLSTLYNVHYCLGT